MSLSTNLQRYLDPAEEVYVSVKDRADYARGFQQGCQQELEWVPGDSPGWYTTRAWRPCWDHGSYFGPRWRLGNARPFFVGWTEASRAGLPLVEKEERILSIAVLAIANIPAENRPEIKLVWDEWDAPEIEIYKHGELIGITCGDLDYSPFTQLMLD